MKIDNFKDRQELELNRQCEKNDVDFISIKEMLEAEKVKRLKKKHHYIQQTINEKIEKMLDYEI